MRQGLEMLERKIVQSKDSIDRAIRNLEARTGKTWAQLCEPWFQAYEQGR